MLHLEGDTDFVQSPAVVWNKLNDLRFLTDCIPDRQSVAFPDPATAVCVVRPGFSFVRGTIEVTLKIAEAKEHELLRIAGHGKGIGSSNDVDLLLKVAGEGTGTKIHWTADITNLGGLLRAVPQGLLRSSAQKVIGDVLAVVKKKLAE